MTEFSEFHCFLTSFKKYFSRQLLSLAEYVSDDVSSVKYSHGSDMKKSVVLVAIAKVLDARLVSFYAR